MRPDGSAAKSDGSARARVFFGLWPPPELAAQLAGIAQAVAHQFGGKPTRQDTIHLTLAFLGNLSERQLPVLCEVASRVVFRPFDLGIDHLGFWARQRLLWAGCRQTPPGLQALATSLQNELRQAGFSVQGGERIFIPHVTLVRKLPTPPGEVIAHQLPVVAALPWRCSQFVLIRSQLGIGGSTYRTVADFPAEPLLD